jgi:hypothetical protein
MEQGVRLAIKFREGNSKYWDEQRRPEGCGDAGDKAQDIFAVGRKP